jgi:hypothetical protein
MSNRRIGPVAVILLAFAACARPGSKSFDTPEAAIEHYAKSIAAADLDAAMQPLAVDDIAARYDFPAVARWLPLMQPATLYAPTNHDVYVRLNKLRLAGEMSNATKMILYSLLGIPVEGAPEKRATDAEIAALVAALDPARLKALKVVRIDQPGKAVVNTPEMIEMHKRHASFHGADDQTERIVLYQLGDQHYWSGFQLLRYGKRWVISQLFSAFVAGSGPGVGKTTPAEYEEKAK